MRRHRGEHCSIRLDVEGNDRSLHHDHPNSQDAELESEGEAVFEVRPHILPRQGRFFFLVAKARVTAQSVNKGARRGEALAEDGRNGASGDRPGEDDDEKEVEGDVEERRTEQEKKRDEGIAHGSKGRDDAVVKKLAKNASVDNREVRIRGFVSFLHDGVGGGRDDAQGFQQRGNQGDARDGQQQADERDEKDLKIERRTHFRLVFLSDRFRDDDTEAGSAAEPELKDGEYETAGVVDPRDFGFGKGFADDGRVCEDIDLLEEQRKNDGDGK